MIRMIQSKSEGHAKTYFSDALSKSDYYTNDQELAGQWRGKLALRLGLNGETGKDAFFALCENRHPETGEHLTPRFRRDRTTGYDINFHCPKSVSVLHVMAEDDHILKAFEKSVEATMKIIEEDCKTRVRKWGKSEDRQTGELVWGQFVHQTARPVDGSAPDPHLHAHCFVFNATWDEQEQKMKAAQFRDIKRDMPYYQACFHKELADRLTEQGYFIQKTDKSFEVGNVPKEIVKLFSKRTDEIGRIAKEKGITSDKERSELGARTRSKKQKGIPMNELKSLWHQQIGDLQLKEKFKGKNDQTIEPSFTQTPVNAQQCIDYAVLHCFERVSVAPDRKLLQEALHFSVGQSGVSSKAIERAFKNDNRIMHVNDNDRVFCTTKEVLKEEKEMVDLARQGKGKLTPLYTEVPHLSLMGQQADAVSHVLTTSDRVSIIRGAAGSGKTTLMKEATQKMAEVGKAVIVVAPSAKASRGVLKEEGFEGATTVAQFLSDQTMQQKLQGQVLWVDEAGLLGTKPMLALLKLATAYDAQLVLGGDTRQHASVDRGDALRVLNVIAGIRPAEVNKIYRQEKQEYRAAVEELAKGKVEAAFEKLDKINFIKEVKPEQLNKMLIEDYLEAVKQKKSALIISPTHAQGEALTDDLRERLRSENLIGKKDIPVVQYKNQSLTEAEKSDHRNYEPGQVIFFNQNSPGFKRGSQWNVKRVEDREVLVSNGEGVQKTLPLDKSKRFDLFTEQKLNLAKGDRIRITRNGTDLDDRRLNNGDEFTVHSTSKFGGITVRHEKSKTLHRISTAYGHLAHGFCTTSHASQGSTVQAVLIAQPASTFPATDAKQFYVSVSRGKERAVIYTDDKEALLEHAKDLRERVSATELMERAREKDLENFVRQNNDLQKLTPVLKPNKKAVSKNYDPEI